MHYFLIYEGAPDYMERRPLFRDEHLRQTWEAVRRGELLLGGAIGEPVEGAAMLWQGDSPKAAADFAAADPYVLNGLVVKWMVKPWATVVGNNASTPLGSNGAAQRAVPVLPSRNIQETLSFFNDLGSDFTSSVHEGTYGLLRIGGAKIHFFLSDDKKLAEWSSCRIEVGDINVLYALCTAKGMVHPNGPLQEKPWGSREFAILDPSGVLHTFAQRLQILQALQHILMLCDELNQHCRLRIRLGTSLFPVLQRPYVRPQVRSKHSTRDVQLVT